jgi:hypothetical protein
MCVLAIAMLENLTVLTMEVLYSLWLPSGHDRPILRVYARGDREDATQVPRGWSGNDRRFQEIVIDRRHREQR